MERLDILATQYCLVRKLGSLAATHFFSQMHAYCIKLQTVFFIVLSQRCRCMLLLSRIEDAMNSHEVSFSL